MNIAKIMLNSSKIKDVSDVAKWRMCMGCGACESACPEKAISLVNIFDKGIRPQINAQSCSNCNQCVSACPGLELKHDEFSNDTIESLRKSWGPVLEVWQGYAADDHIRYKGSSGGVLTALSAYCLEHGEASQVFHIGTKDNAPLLNVPVVSKSKDDLLKRTGSRYAPAAPCTSFSQMKKTKSQSVFIGKPCDVAALRKAQKNNADLKEKTAIALSFCCAGTPTQKGTAEILKAMAISADDVDSFRYRGNGWPGMATAVQKNGDKHEMTYEATWGKILSKNSQLRCRLCPDSTGEFADISCGDPWYMEADGSDPGQSMVLVRTKRGQMLLRRAIAAKYVTLKQVDPETLPKSQASLHKKRKNIFGRFLALSLFRIPHPTYSGFSLIENWKDLSIKNQIKSVLGTIKRILVSKWYTKEPF